MILPQTTSRFIFHFVRRQWLKFTIMGIISIIWATNDSFFPYFLKRIVNSLQNYHGVREYVYVALKPVLILLLVFWLITEVLQRVQGILVQVFTFPKFRAQVRETMFGYVKSHSHEYFSSNFAGSIAKKLSDMPTSAQTIVEIIGYQFVTAMTGSMIVLVMMWKTSPFFALILIVWLILHLGLTFLFLRSGHKLWEQHSNSTTVLSGKIIDILTNILNVRAFSRKKYEASYMKKYQDDEIKKARRASWQVEIMRIGLGISGLFLIFGMIFTLIHGWIHHWVTLGDFTQVEMQSFWLLGWIWFVSYQMTVFVRELGTVRDSLSIVKKSHDIIDAPNATSLFVKKGAIVFKNVCFSYRNNHPVFQDFNLALAAGQKIGLVGFSGSGKTTFSNLILRFYDIQSGKILIDDQDIAQVTQDSLRENIAMIPQDPALFHRTLMENIRYGRIEATDEEVIQASKLAHCHEFIQQLDDQYDSLVGERGIKLSGGQRQRIAIARAILKQAPILILDEATSSLDTLTEKLIQESLNILMKERTTIVIAHRLSTLSNMDRILVFHEGKIIEDGSKESLLAAKGHFYMLWNMQTDGFLPEHQ